MLKTACNRGGARTRAERSRGDRAKDRAKNRRRTTRSTDAKLSRNRAVAGNFGVELAGLEPATSWVRSRRPVALNLACLRGFPDGGDPICGPRFRPISAHFGRDRAKEKGLWPDLRSAPAGPRRVGRPLHSPAVTGGTGRVRTHTCYSSNSLVS